MKTEITAWPAAALLVGAVADGGLLDGLRGFLARNWDTLAVAVVVPAILVLTDRALRRRAELHLLSRLQRQFWMLAISAAGLLWIILTLEAGSRSDLLTLLGILLSAAIAFSSTTLIGNAMAGFMLRAERRFSFGDYLQVGEHFGSVSERGLFFTEIQNELADYVTLPNSYLATQPVTVWRTPSTLIKAEVSLGYDVPRSKVRQLLLAAAEAAGLDKPHVFILALGDFSVTYRVTGRLGDTKELLTARSKLCGRVLDALHEGGVEIVSPAFMNQRALATEKVFIPAPQVERESPDEAAESEMFTKAERAASAERLKEMVAELEEKIRHTKEALGKSASEAERAELEAGLEIAKRRQARLLQWIEEREEAAD